LHAFVGGIIRKIDGVPESIGGMADHIHLLLGLKSTHCLADVLREAKQASSEWVHQIIGQSIFSWQDGYGAFTVSFSQLPTVKHYIENQCEHHRKRSFQEEYLELLRKSQIQFDERYLW